MKLIRKTALAPLMALIVIGVTDPVHAIDRSVSCENCSLVVSGSTSAAKGTPPVIQFPVTCPGEAISTDGNNVTITTTKFGALGESCTVEALIDTESSHLISTANGSITYQGMAPQTLALISGNGSVAIQGDGDLTDLSVESKNGRASLVGVAGNLTVSSANDEIHLEGVYATGLVAHAVNGNMNIRSLVLEGKRTAILKVDNGSVKIRGLRGVQTNPTNLKKKRVKVRVIGHAVNGSFRDRRRSAERPLNAKERRVAAIVRIQTVNGDIIVR